MVHCPRCNEHFDEIAHSSPRPDPDHAGAIAVHDGAHEALDLARCPACGHEFEVPSEA